MSQSFAYELVLDTLTEEESVGAIGRLSEDKTTRAFREPQRKHTSLPADDPRLTPIETEEDYRALLATEKYTKPPTAEELEQQRQSEVQQMIRNLEDQVSRIRKKATQDVYGIDTEFAQIELAAQAYKAGSANAHQLEVVSGLAAYYQRTPEGVSDYVVDTLAPKLHELIDLTGALLWNARAALRDGRPVDEIKVRLDAIEASQD